MVERDCFFPDDAGKVELQIAERLRDTSDFFSESKVAVDLLAVRQEC